MFLKTKSYIITEEGKIIWLKSKSKNNDGQKRSTNS